MLHAVNRKKARLDTFRGPGQKVPLEDMVTSTIFGPLLFIDALEATAAVAMILSALDISPPAWVGPAHLSLWPKRKTVEILRSSYVEPDAEIVDASGNALVIEVKWGASLSDHELASQWLALSAEARARSRHLLIVLEPDRYHGAIVRDRIEIARHCALPWSIRMVTWRRMADAFREVGADMRLNPGTRRWAMGVHGFLRREDPRSLGGWDALDLVEVPNGSWRFARRLITLPDDLAASAWRYSEGWFGAPAEIEPMQWRYGG